MRSWLRRRVMLNKLIEAGECTTSIGKSGETFYNLTAEGNRMAKLLLEKMCEKDAEDDLLGRHEVTWGNKGDSLEIWHRQSGWYVETHRLPVANFGENFFIHYYDGFPTLEKAVETIRHYLWVIGIEDINVTKMQGKGIEK